MQLKEALASAVDRLTRKTVPSPRMNAEVLLMFALGCDRAYLYAHPERELTSDETARYETALAERARGVPSQYITGHQEFWGMDFIVTPAVLIPRPETELVVETVIERAAADLTSGIRIADVGTGSGCVALALAKELPWRKFTQLTIQQQPLRLLARTPPAINWNHESTFIRPIYSQASSKIHSTTLCPIPHMLANRKRIKSNSRCGNLSREPPCLPDTLA